MKCERCTSVVPEGEQRALHGQILCEDCYMDALSPARTCDPWAVQSAKSFVEQSAGGLELTGKQQQILEILKQTGGVPLDNLACRLKMKLPDLEREIASLRHMEKVMGALKNRQKIIYLW